MTTSVLHEVRLTAFKSFRDEVLPIDPITVLTGRNSSGKSNALDAIEVLARLATGEDLADALDGRRREDGPIRGGSRGCAPHGSSSFQLGCTVRTGRGEEYFLDVEVQVEPDLRIVHESLRGRVPVDEDERQKHTFLRTRDSAAHDSGLEADVLGLDRPARFRDSRLLTSQLVMYPSTAVRGDEHVADAARSVVAALQGVFHLDPIPHLMRDYVPARDNDLRRTAANISAAIGRMRDEDHDAFASLQELVRQVGDESIRRIAITRSELGDVMLALDEESDSGRPELTPAREMSDGLLRFIAIATSLLSSTRSLDIDDPLGDEVRPGVLLVVEEMENGLHPSQAGRALELIKAVSEAPTKQVMVTTHSPAMLNAMTGGLTRSVVVCYRDEDTHRSRLSRLPDLPGYAEAMASGRLGDVVSAGQLVRPAPTGGAYDEFNRLLGIE